MSYPRLRHPVSDTRADVSLTSFAVSSISHSTSSGQPFSKPSYGINSTAESGAYEDGYYEEDGEEWELEEELAKLDEYYGCTCHPSFHQLFPEYWIDADRASPSP